MDKLAFLFEFYPLTQDYNHIKPVQDFIADHQLKRADGVTSFAATVMYNDMGVFHSIISEVQIIHVFETMAVYIFEFFKDEYRFQEMYSTQNFNFGYKKGSALEISNSAMQHRLHIAIIPLP
jgi:hypothetical protein